MSDSDLTFITNEKDKSLLERFRVLIKDCDYFDALVGYFFISGFYQLYPSLEDTDKVRILIGLETDKRTYDLLEKAKKQQELPLNTHAETKKQMPEQILKEFEVSEDTSKIEEGVRKFIEWIRNGKLEIKAYPTDKIHAKLYVMTFKEGDRDKGRVITGSSNFSQSGLMDNLEFNVELKNPSDYDFALNQFNSLWENAVDVSEIYVNTIEKKSPYAEFTPYELYLKFLYEYFKRELAVGQEVNLYKPQGFKTLEYQSDAVSNAKRILEEYGGVFLSDVVGLGKTYMASMLAQHIDGRNLVLAPPALLDRSNPGSWPNVFEDFQIRQSRFESIGKLDQLLKTDLSKYKNVFIDEAHRFRTETTASYEKLARICRGKRVILVTATPLNNSPKDILSQIKLFQKGKKSTIPNMPDIESFFSRLDGKIRKLDRKEDRDEYLESVKMNSKEIREKVLKYLMIRRTRTEISKYYKDDLAAQKLKFPKVENPKPFYYKFNEYENEVFTKTLQLFNNEFKYTRYTPMLYHKGGVSHSEELGQRNMGKFMKILLIKRLESSFYAFKQSIDRFIWSYESFINEFEEGNVYMSKKHSNKIFEFLENEDDVAIQKLIDDDKAERHESKEFSPEFEVDLHNDLAVLKEVKAMWDQVTRDPKLTSLKERLESSPKLRDKRLIIFTESKETAEYLEAKLKDAGKSVIVYTGSSGSAVREKVIENFDANVRHPKDDYQILIATETLSEGVNLHRSNVVINYDIPWNPTRMIQRVGRINRVDTKFDEIFTYNFFPTDESNDEIKLKEAAELKIGAFIEMLGNDARLLTEGEEVKSHDLFKQLNSKNTITGEDEDQQSELEYLNEIKAIRENDLDLYEKIKRLPKKARSSKNVKIRKSNSVLSYVRKGKLEKFFISSACDQAEELDFFEAVSFFKAKEDEKHQSVGKDFYEMLERNKEAFILSTADVGEEKGVSKGRDARVSVLKTLKAIKNFQGFTEDDDEYLKEVMRLVEESALPKQTFKTLSQNLSKEDNPMKILGLLKLNIPEEFFLETVGESAASTSGPREVILSEYLVTKL
ncbi:helicase [Candidatus Peregrinibacteria bacterium]|jgi:superfamily II DNA/RNA helicase/HKD family nuclease|nr:helicase [Candidatus Peregrinibacteria bacterium]MBT7703121.1 helicase [Candidatus Peregrinibacteria bacterium]